MVVRNTNIVSQKEYNDASNEYGQIVKESVIPNVNDMILDEVWNV